MTLEIGHRNDLFGVVRCRGQCRIDIPSQFPQIRRLGCANALTNVHTVRDSMWEVESLEHSEMEG